MAIPNFDAMDKGELMEFWKRYARPSRKDAEELIGDRRKGFTTISGTLAAYASNKATAISCRLKGKIDAALGYEEACEKIYERLPADLRW